MTSETPPAPLPWYRKPVAAYLGPFAAFMILMQVIQWVRTEAPDAPWWQANPEHWGYPLQAIVCLGLVWFWRKHYPKFSSKGFDLGIAMGCFGIALWLLPAMLHMGVGLGSESNLPWLKWLGFTERREGFNPFQFGENSSPILLALIIGFRFLRLVVAVSLVEEIFWRGFLMPWLTDPDGDWRNRELRTCSTRSIWLTAVACALAHIGPDFFVALLYGALAGWLARHTNNLWAVVVMHAVANLALGAVIMLTEWWGLW